MLAGSNWLSSDPELPDFAKHMFVENAVLRQATRARTRDLLCQSGPPRRVLEVAFEVFIQSLALAFDLRDATRSADTTVRSWARQQHGWALSAPNRLLARIDDSGDDLACIEADTSPYSVATARRLRICLESLGPTFVKFGQLLGSAHGLLPDEIVEEFARCHDAVRPEKPSAVFAVVEAELGSIQSVFGSFDPQPLASASIAQVHAATLRSGKEVAVKIQRPGVRQRMEADVAVLYRLATASDRVDLLNTLNLVGMTELFAATTLEELDFRLETENMIDMALLLEHADITDVVVPRPVPHLVTERVIVMERLHGRRLCDIDDRQDATTLLRIGTQAVLEGALTYGVFHGDMHAGNMLALDDGRHALLDFGIVGHFDYEQRWALTRWLASMATENLPLQLAALSDLGAFPPETDLGEVSSQVEVVLEKLAVADPDRVTDLAKDFELVARILARHGLRVPPELALFLKNLLHVTGQARQLVPDHDPVDVTGVMTVADMAYRNGPQGLERRTESDAHTRVISAGMH